MDPQVVEALARDAVVDITTTGRKSGEPRRIEINIRQVGGVLYICGRPPRPRSWYANLLADPSFTLHVKEGVNANVPATAAKVTDADERKAVITELLNRSSRGGELEEWLRASPLVRVSLQDG
jgi:deazaflavin-dependent oxidoreductase (nitroreductase family)